MRRAWLFVLVPVLLVGCKRRPPEEAPAPAPAAAPAEPKPVPEETVDALNPPPPPRVDLAQRANTANGDPNGPKTAELDAANADGQRKVQACLDGLPATALPGGAARLTVKYSIGNDGKAHDIGVEGGSPEANDCGKRAIDAAAFPKFQGAPVNVAFNLNYSRPQAPPDLAH
jgi:hypothetical protein